jgi:hypothetical protein
MKDLIAVQKIVGWEKLKALVLDSVSSPITKRVYNMALEEFLAWVPAGAAARLHQGYRERVASGSTSLIGWLPPGHSPHQTDPPPPPPFCALAACANKRRARILPLGPHPKILKGFRLWRLSGFSA